MSAYAMNQSHSPRAIKHGFQPPGLLCRPCFPKEAMWLVLDF